MQACDGAHKVNKEGALPLRSLLRFRWLSWALLGDLDPLEVGRPKMPSSMQMRMHMLRLRVKACVMTMSAGLVARVEMWDVREEIWERRASLSTIWEVK